MYSNQKKFFFTLTILVFSGFLLNASEEPWYKRLFTSFTAALVSNPVWIQSKDGRLLEEIKPDVIKLMHYPDGSPVKAQAGNSKAEPLIIPLNGESLVVLLHALDSFPFPKHFKRYVTSLNGPDQYRLVRAVRVTNAIYVEEALSLALGKNDYMKLLKLCIDNDPAACSADKAGMYMRYQYYKGAR